MGKKNLFASMIREDQRTPQAGERTPIEVLGADLTAWARDKSFLAAYSHVNIKRKNMCRKKGRRQDCLANKERRAQIYHYGYYFAFLIF